MRKLIAGIVAAVYSVMLTASPVLAPDTGVTATLTVEAVCEFSVTPTPINFGSTDGTSNEQTLGPQTVTASNDGNTDITSLDVYGIDWEGTNPLNTMDVTQTDYDDSSGFTDLTLSTGTSVFGGSLADDASNTVDFQVTVPADQPADDYDQTITFTFGCDQLG